MDWQTFANELGMEIMANLGLLLGWGLLVMIGTLYGTLFWGRNYKKRFADMQKKIDEVSQKQGNGSIHQTVVNVTQASDGTFVSRIQPSTWRRVGSLVTLQLPERVARIGTKNGVVIVPFGDRPEILYEISCGLRSMVCWKRWKAMSQTTSTILNRSFDACPSFLLRFLSLSVEATLVGSPVKYKSRVR